eukprot:3677952-Heterocapsa_arctica.AAC.1
MAELVAEQVRNRGPTIFVPGMLTATPLTVKLVGRVDSHPNPARVLGPSGAGCNTSSTPFTQ